MATTNNQEQQYPIPTGYASGNGLQIMQTSENQYSDGQVNWSKDQFQMALQMGFLTKFTAVKSAVTKAAAKAAEPKLYKYSVTVQFTKVITFESSDPDLSASELSFETLKANLPKDINLSIDDIIFSIVKGKRKSGGSGSSGSSNSQQPFTAADRSELKDLSLIEKKMLKEMASPNGLALSKHASFGVQTDVKLGNKLIDFRRKGYYGAVRQAGSCIFFDAGSMYDGYDISHSL